MKEARKFRQVCSSCRNRLANLKVIVAQLRPSKISCSRSRTLLGHEKNVHYSAVHYGALTSPTYFAFSWLECEVWRARTEAYHKTCRNPEVSVMLLRHLLFPVYLFFYRIDSESLSAFSIQVRNGFFSGQSTCVKQPCLSKAI